MTDRSRPLCFDVDALSATRAADASEAFHRRRLRTGEALAALAPDLTQVSGRALMVVMSDFGDGAALLALWAHWRRHRPAQRLCVVVLDPAPVARQTIQAVLSDWRRRQPSDPGLALGEALLRAWPLPLPGMQRIDLDDGGLTLTVCQGAREAALGGLQARVDLFHMGQHCLTGDARRPGSARILKTLARLADEAAWLLVAPSGESSPEPASPLTSHSLRAAGFTAPTPLAGDHLLSRFAPRWQVRRHAPRRPVHAPQREALVIGAGVAGCAVVAALARRGWRVTLLERAPQLAAGASGNPSGVFHPPLARDDTPMVRFGRTAFLLALRRWPERVRHGLIWRPQGLLQLDDGELADAAFEQGWACAGLRRLTREQASAQAGLPLASGGLLFPSAGWLVPASLCQASVASAGEALRLRLGVEVRRLRQQGKRWEALDEQDSVLAQADLVVLANASAAAALVPACSLPLQDFRGQLSCLRDVPRARLPVIGDGYLTPHPQGMLVGATYTRDDADPAVRDTDHLDNLAKAAQLSEALAGLSLSSIDGGRTGWRCTTPDHLPMIGQLPSESAAAACGTELRGAQLADLPRTEGLYGAFAFGSRGLLWSELAAEILLAQFEGEPAPVDTSLLNAVDPARYFLRSLRTRLG